ncbi:MAG: alpha/beta fold hydrolase [Gracilimonas sp.]|nr:alpha/beta fold hydrolase [Gracilimonas sp.]
MRSFILFLSTFLFSVLNLHAQTSILGNWEGAINIQGQQLKVIFNIEGESNNLTGTIDIPQQGAMGLKLTQAEQRADSVFLTFFTGQGNGKFEGTFQADSLIRGTYSQGAASFPFEIQKQHKIEAKDQKTGLGKDLIITADNNTIGGTLVTPDNSKPSPLVILISGSGAQDRDSNIFGFKVFAELSEQLKKEGISSFRFDDRQVGQSSGAFAEATLQMLSEDVGAIIDHLLTLENHQFQKIILLGHSQGGVVAGKLAAQNEKIDKLILMASTGVPLKDVLRFQVKEAFGSGIYPEAQVEKEINLRESLMEAIRHNGHIETTKENYASHYKKMLNTLSVSQRANLGNIDSLAQEQASQLEQAYSSPQMQSLLFYDPKIDLEQLEIPVLVLFGGKDTQVTETLNRQPIKRALERSESRYEIELFSNANHLFQKANTGQVIEYQTLEKKFISGFTDTLSTWILEN